MKALPIAFALLLPALAQVRAGAAQVSPPPRIVYAVPGMEKVETQKNVAYKSIGEVTLRMDIYLPPKRIHGSPSPAVIFIPGAADNPKDWPSYVSWGQLAAASGLIGVTFTHRLGFPVRRYEEGASDVIDLIKYVRDNAASFNLDQDRICLAVFSGGGPMLTVALREPPPYIRCLVGFYSFLSTEHVDLETAGTTREVLETFSPVNYIALPGRVIPPIFIARAGKDQIPGVNQSIDHFVRVTLERNLSLDLFNHPDGPHGFDARDDSSRSRELIAHAIRFMKAHLTNP